MNQIDTTHNDRSRRDHGDPLGRCLGILRGVTHLTCGWDRRREDGMKEPANQVDEGPSTQAEKNVSNRYVVSRAGYTRLVLRSDPGNARIRVVHTVPEMVLHLGMIGTSSNAEPL